MVLNRQLRDAGFSLIELLVVVAILSILSAISLVNLQQAQTRAKVSRVRSDLRVIATSLEAYAVDYNVYPQQTYVSAMLLNELVDPFAITDTHIYMCEDDKTGFRLTDKSYRYRLQEPFYCDTLASVDYFNDTTITKSLNLLWTVHSIGPDIDDYNGELSYIMDDPTEEAKPKAKVHINTIAIYQNYDPTNGTVSFGNLFRTNVNPEKVGPHPLLETRLGGCPGVLCAECPEDEDEETSSTESSS
jgi:prepilin-type N-terminal cleavage/methylation domain-containing protein